MSAAAWLLWAAAVWTLFLAYCAIDVPLLVSRLTDRYRHGGQP
ncbi:hypothetical protein ACFZB5_13935 [Streptomyces nodosus]